MELDSSVERDVLRMLRDETPISDRLRYVLEWSKSVNVADARSRGEFRRFLELASSEGARGFPICDQQAQQRAWRPFARELLRVCTTNFYPSDLKVSVCRFLGDYSIMDADSSSQGVQISDLWAPEPKVADNAFISSEMSTGTPLQEHTTRVSASDPIGSASDRMEEFRPTPFGEFLSIVVARNSAPNSTSTDGFLLWHLTMSVLACVTYCETHALATSMILSWCRAAQISPRVLANVLINHCASPLVVWSYDSSDFQIFRTGEPRSVGSLSSTAKDAPALPEEVTLKILSTVDSIMREHGRCTLEMLSAELNWSRGSDLRAKYGNLRHVVKALPGVFYDPDQLYLSSALSLSINFPPA